MRGENRDAVTVFLSKKLCNHLIVHGRVLPSSVRRRRRLTAVLLSALCCGCLQWRKRDGAIQLDDTHCDKATVSLTDPTGNFPILPSLDPQMIPDDIDISWRSFLSVTSRIVSAFEGPEQ
jgi:hypothetical protein